MDGLWTNRSALSDFVQNGLNQYKAAFSEAYIAVAFFTEGDVIRDILDSGCHVRMVVRLGFPTNPSVLRQFLNNPSIELRYYSSTSFHPKLYVFGDKVALLGSANLTRAAILTNQEIMVAIESDDQRFDELTALFGDYWNEAKVLNEEALDAYESVYKKYGKAISEVSRIDDETIEKVGKVEFSNIRRGEKKPSKENIFLENYRKTYQESVSAFVKIKEVYESVGKRKNDFHDIPLRLEIDSFCSFVRDVHATHESWKEAPVGWDDDKKSMLLSHVREWMDTEWRHYDEQICYENYPLITKVFSSEESIDKASYDEIIEALVVLHSFHDRLRFYSGGLDTLKREFKEHNELSRVKSSLNYLLFGKGDIVKRMADLIYDNAYKLSEFGQANVQELIGWINREDLPVINGRTTKVFRYYGFDVRQL